MKLPDKRYWMQLAVLAVIGFLWMPMAFAADTTPPTTPVVTDDGIYTVSSTQLHAAWRSQDPQSGIAEYRYQIRQSSISGPVIVGWTSTGTTASVTRTRLSLAQGKIYYFGVKAKNRAGLWSAVGYSNGIIVDKNPPVITALNPPNNSSAIQADKIPVSVTASDPDGDSLKYQFSIDGVVQQPWSSGSSWSWDTTPVTSGWHTVRVEVKDIAQTQSKECRVFILRRPPTS